MNRYNSVRQECEQFNRRVLKEAVLPYLRSIGCLRVEASYDGSGDDGQLYVNEYLGVNNETIDPADAKFDYEWADYEHGPEGGKYIKKVDSRTVEDFVEDLMYQVLNENYGGWEINEGSFGTVSLNPQTEKISITHNARHEAYDTYEHEEGI